ncbi:metallophosphoesterase [Amycolatopsis roodepoortensis]|uniref:metallophosphoesterase n=1 Tax=Amycolatopsis roodepoortensis TaxID=700274 RepID=UPI00214B04B8|nr:metallophosphoesterase [Amycolatopsis roodepoortensis]UUV30470.1 metallophosphoesterase [Amycolatopsis roodepoortensis]
MFVTAHLSDNHLDGGERADERTARVMRYLENLATPVDAILVTGDITDHGTLEEYGRAAELFKTDVPLFVCPGNHDKRGPFREGLLGQTPDDAPVNAAHTVGDVTFVMADSTIPGKPDGQFDDETMAWLDAVLGDGDGPAFIAFHHPPVALGLPLVDAMRQYGEEKLAEVLARHPRVVALLCGHVHAAASTTFAGVPLRSAPSVGSSILFPWEENGLRSWGEGGPVDYDLPPSLLFHVLHEDGRLTTHQRVVPA